jgi:hypothetical protein
LKLLDEWGDKRLAIESWKTPPSDEPSIIFQRSTRGYERVQRGKETVMRRFITIGGRRLLRSISQTGGYPGSVWSNAAYSAAGMHV